MSLSRAAGTRSVDDSIPRQYFPCMGNDVGSEANTLSGLFGDHNFIHDPRTNNATLNALLIAPKTMDDFRRIFGQRRNQIELRLEIYGDRRKEFLGFQLFVDGKEPRKGSTICPFSLLESTHRGDFFDIHTCTCMNPGCAGIRNGTAVSHSGAEVLWKSYPARPRRVFLFDRTQYCSEIFRACRHAVEFLGLSNGRSLELEMLTPADLEHHLQLATAEVEAMEERK